MEDLTVKRDKDRNQFYFFLNEKKATVQYEQPRDNLLKLTDTFVPKEFRSQGVASELARQVLEYCERTDYELIITCPFLKSYLKKHPEYKKLLLEERDQA